MRIEHCMHMEHNSYAIGGSFWDIPENVLNFYALHHSIFVATEDLTTLQSIMNAIFSQRRFWHCNENGLIKTIQMIPHNLYVSVKFNSLYCGLGSTRIILNP